MIWDAKSWLGQVTETVQALTMFSLETLSAKCQLCSTSLRRLREPLVITKNGTEVLPVLAKQIAGLEQRSTNTV